MMRRLAGAFLMLLCLGFSVYAQTPQEKPKPTPQETPVERQRCLPISAQGFLTLG
jgi:hypothetical protein